MNANFAAFLYLVSGVLFIMALRGLSHPATSRKGNTYGMVGMGIAIVTTLLLAKPTFGGFVLIVLGLAIGGGAGAVIARRIAMTSMPQLVAAFHSLVGLAAVMVAAAAMYAPESFGIGTVGDIHAQALVEMSLGVAIGAITFTGSIIAFLKLDGRMSGKPILLTGRHFVNAGLAIALVVLVIMLVFTQSTTVFWLIVALSLALGVLIIVPIGGADMPVVVSMLNSYSGWAAAGIGFSLNNSMLIIAGSLVGSSGAILSYIMCKAMNRSFFNVLLGGFGNTADAGPAGAQEARPVKSGSADDATFLLTNADTVIIVPGYGLAVARAQHALKELTEKLTHRGVTVKYAIHPVAGRMPGHMNVLLAEAEVPYDQVFEMEDINSEFGQADVVLVLGANDVVNPAAKNDPKSPIAGMPILEAFKAKTIIVNKRSMASGYAGLDNELFYLDKTMMVFGDAKKVIEDMVKAVE